LGRSHSTDSLIAETLERTTAAASPRKLNMLQLVMITYFSVSGGPFGLESIVGEAGPRISLLGLCVIPWVWALPQALMTAELATAIPEMGGYVVWVHRAFGEAAGFQVGVWKTVESLLDLALYPVLLVSYAEAFLQREMSSVMRWLVSAAILAAVALINVLGAEMVGDYSTAFGVVVLLPFLILVLVGLKDISFDAMLAGSAPPAAGEEAEPIDWGIFFAILLWNTSGFDSAGTCAGEVAEPARVYLPAMVTTLCLTVLTYLLPVAVGVSVTAGAAGGFDAWRTGHFVEVGRLVGGPWLAGWIAAAGAVSALALLTSLLCTSSRALAALAELGMAPAALGRIHPTHGTPHVAVLANAVLTSCLVLLDFEVIAEMAMCLYCLAMLFELLSLAHLRTVEPALPRPYRIPVSDTWGIRMFVAPPCLLCLGLVANSGPQPAALGVCVVGATALVHVCWRRRCTPSLVRARDQLRRVRERGPYATLRGVMGVTEGERDAEVEALVPQPDGLTGR
jgi:amino acid transporter